MRYVIAAAMLSAATGCAEMQRHRGADGRSGSAYGGVPASQAGDVETVAAGGIRARGLPEVLASFPAPLWAAPEPNRTVEPCRRAVETESRQEGPAMVEAAGRGPERRLANGLYDGAVEIRITYAQHGLHLVRQATLRCTTTADGILAKVELWPSD
jgi:hypothetical protein